MPFAFCLLPFAFCLLPFAFFLSWSPWATSKPASRCANGVAVVVEGEEAIEDFAAGGFADGEAEALFGFVEVVV